MLYIIFFLIMTVTIYAVMLWPWWLCAILAIPFVGVFWYSGRFYRFPVDDDE